MDRWNGDDIEISPLLFDEIKGIKDVVGKILCVNINYTLPSLLHINNQICRGVGVKGFNPLANIRFINYANSFNVGDSKMPKGLLREVRSDLPESIYHSDKKLGFQIPLETWNTLDDFMRLHHEKFFSRKNIHIPKYKYDGITRQSWGVLMADLFLRRYE